MKLVDLVEPEAIIPELASKDRNGAIRELVSALAQAKRIAADAAEGIIKSIIARERNRGTTGIGKGAALPHAKVDGLPKAVAAFGRSSAGIEFSSLDGKPVHSVFLILSSNEQPAEHLEAMELVFRHLQSEKFRKFVRQSDSAKQLYDLMVEADEKSLAS